ncbi:MAG: glycosyltransferase family 1 protein [Crocinitomicaceae bacterium]|nr:glycosyltransferase family 4 protein [Crocinitomicaceae bacterium]
MKILFDNQCFYLHGKGGISRYIANLIKSLQKIEGVEVIFQPHQVYEFFAHDKSFKTISIKGYNRFKLERNKKRDLAFVRENIDKVDWYFPTYYHPDFIQFLGKTPTALIIHDMIHEVLPNESNNADLHSSWKKAYIEKSSKYFTVSDNTKADLNHIYPATLDKTYIIYPGFFFEDIKSTPIVIPEKYFLYVGGRSFYKNFEMLLDKKVIDLCSTIVCVGGGQFSAGEKKKIKSLTAINHFIHLRPNQSELRFLYENASAYISTSKYEGFGLPVLEAIECGTKLILRDTKIYREITQNNAAYFSDAESLVEVLKDENNEQPQINTAEYNWNKSAQKLVDLLV